MALDLISVQPEKAVEYWGTRSPALKSALPSMSAQAQQRAFVVSGLTRMDQVKEFYTAMERAIVDGESFDSFKKRVDQVAQEAALKPWRVETIFRTNIQTAYNAGRYARMQSVKKVRPYWQYEAVGDERTRPEHAALNGMVFPADDVFWSEHFPPNGFNCRCSVRSMSQREVEAEGKEITNGPIGSIEYKDPDTGKTRTITSPGASGSFKSNPGKDWLAGLAAAEIESGSLIVAKQNNLTPLGTIDKRHIVEILQGDLLPENLSELEYASAFLAEFGLGINDSKVFMLKGVNLPVVISRELLEDKSVVPYVLKSGKGGRGPYLKLLAKTIINPYEMWLLPAIHDETNNIILKPSIKLLRVFQGEKKKIGGFASFKYDGKHWSGSTVFAPRQDRSEARIIDYLEKERVGELVYREK